ncbi:MAG TPA: FMN-binding negative transcriptional regulator [Steroidobacteraceae bacterium]
MYVPKQHEELDVAVLQALIRAHPLGAWVTLDHGGLVANHIPFLMDANRGDCGTLIGHVARANDAWKHLSATAESMVIFQGAESYITPSWYPSKHAHGKAVPTWNYAVVHAYGVPVAIEEREWLLAHVNQLTDIHEAGQALPWKVSDAPMEYVDKMLQGIVGIEIPIKRLVGKWKTSQNRSDSDRLGVTAGLMSRSEESGRVMASLVSQSITTSKRN